MRMTSGSALKVGNNDGIDEGTTFKETTSDQNKI